MSSNPVANFHDATEPLRDQVPQADLNELVARVAAVITRNQLHHAQAKKYETWRACKKEHNQQLKQIDAKYPIDPEVQKEIKTQTKASNDQFRKETAEAKEGANSELKDLKNAYEGQKTAVKERLEQHLIGLGEDHAARVQQINNTSDPTHEKRAAERERLREEFDNKCLAEGLCDPTINEKQRMFVMNSQLLHIMVWFMLQFPFFGENPNNMETIVQTYNTKTQRMLLMLFSESNMRVRQMLEAGRSVYIKYGLPAWLRRCVEVARVFVDNFRQHKKTKAKESAQVRHLTKLLERKDDTIAVLQERIVVLEKTVFDVDPEQPSILSEKDWNDANPVARRTRGQKRKGNDVFYEEDTREALTRAIREKRTLISDARGADTTRHERDLARLKAKLNRTESTQQ